MDAAGERVDLAAVRRGGRVEVDLGGSHPAGDELAVTLAYGGVPRPAPMPPWDGGFVWDRDRGGAPWIGVACQLDGADLWWPTKDHPGDELDDGADLRFTVPRRLTVVANGTLEGVTRPEAGRRTWHWRTVASINGYDVTFNAGRYRTIERRIPTAGGGDVRFVFWVLREDLRRAEALLPEILDQVAFLEEVAGPFPFAGDKLGFVETPYVAMEHQTAVAHGKAWDLERQGFHFLPLHELSHEWFGNLVTAADWSDLWIHEGFATYLEALYVEERRGAAAGRHYVAEHLRDGITNDRPLAPRESRTIRDSYSTEFTDPYTKGASVLHALRWLIGDEVFRRGLRRVAYPDPASEGSWPPPARHETTEGVRRTFEQACGCDLGWFWEVYLRQAELPRLDAATEDGVLTLEWVVPEGLGFELPVEIELPDGERRRVEMVGGRAAVPWPWQRAAKVDPDGWLLRAE